MAKNIWVYMTAADGIEALAIGRALVEQRLAACVNILGPIRSLYLWEGKVNDEREVALIAKTRSALLPKLTAAVKELHSYECPCIVALPIIDGSPDFLAWIAEQSKSGTGRKAK